MFIDSNVLFRASGAYPEDPRTPACEELYDHCIETGKTLVISAVTVAEYLRKNSVRQAFRTIPGVEVVSFDLEAAHVLGNDMPMAKLIELKEAHAGANDYWKYDALIVATAKRWGVALVVSLDSGLRATAEKIGLKAAEPADLQQMQTALDL